MCLLPFIVKLNGNLSFPDSNTSSEEGESQSNLII